MNLKTFIKVTVVAVGLMLLGFSYASAAPLTITTWDDTASKLTAIWHWNNTGTTQSITNADTLWQANLQIGPKISVPGLGDLGWVVSWGFDHLKGPHAEDINPAPFASFADFALNQPGSVITKSGVWGHPTTTGTHWDYWTFNFVRNTLTDADITLTVSHTPIPAAAWLLGSGLLGLIGIGRRSFFGKV